MRCDLYTNATYIPENEVVIYHIHVHWFVPAFIYILILWF